MRPQSLFSTIIAAVSLISSSSAVPFAHLLKFEALIPRASYSVVGVDGGCCGSATSIGAGAAVTVIETIVQTASAALPTTLTLISIETDFTPGSTEVSVSTTTVTGQDTTETDFVPGPTEVLTSAVTISGQKTTETSFVPGPTEVIISTTTITTSVSGKDMTQTLLVTIQPTSVTVLISEMPAPTTIQTTLISITTTQALVPPVQDASSTPFASSSSSSSSTTKDPSNPSSTSTTLLSSSSSSSSAVVTESTATFTTIEISTSTTITTTTPALLTSTPSPSKSSDDGVWHTVYPPWTNGTVIARRPNPRL